MNELRTTLRDDLIAAKALAQTPDGLSLFRISPINATKKAADEDLGRGVACLIGLWSELPREFSSVARYFEVVQPANADIMELFDRAIAAASVQS